MLAPWLKRPAVALATGKLAHAGIEEPSPLAAGLLALPRHAPRRDGWLDAGPVGDVWRAPSGAGRAGIHSAAAAPTALGALIETIAAQFANLPSARLRHATGLLVYWQQ